jgi:hypothetical protein
VVAATAKQLAEQILHPAVSPRFDLGIQDGMSLGMAVLSLRAAIGRLAFTIWLYILALYKEQAVSKEEILEAIQKTAAELGRAPSMPELRDKTGISPRQVRRNFLSYGGALKACGLEKGGAGYTTPMNAVQGLGRADAETGQGAEDWRVRDVRKIQRQAPAHPLWNVGRGTGRAAICGRRAGLGRGMGGRNGGGARPSKGRGEAGKEVKDGQQDA